jgi:hypothetical protein
VWNALTTAQNMMEGSRVLATATLLDEHAGRQQSNTLSSCTAIDRS